MKLSKLVLLLTVPLILSGCKKKDTKNYFPEDEIKQFLVSRNQSVDNYNLPVYVSKSNLQGYTIVEDDYLPYFEVFIKDADGSKFTEVDGIISELEFTVSEEYHIDPYDEFAVKYNNYGELLYFDVFSVKDIDGNKLFFPENEVKGFLTSRDQDITNYNLPIQFKKVDFLSYSIQEHTEYPCYHIEVKDKYNDKVAAIDTIATNLGFHEVDGLKVDSYNTFGIEYYSLDNVLYIDLYAFKDIDDNTNFFPTEEIKAFLVDRGCDVTNFNFPVEYKKREFVSYNVVPGAETPSYYSVVLKDQHGLKYNEITELFTTLDFDVDGNIHIDPYIVFGVELYNSDAKLYVNFYAISDLTINTREKGVVKYELPASLTTTEGVSSYTIEADYNNDYFRHSATVLDNNLKLLSYGSSVVSERVGWATNFYQTMRFDNFEDHEYVNVIDEDTGETAPYTKDSIGHFFAHKNIPDTSGDFELYAVCIRGFGYGSEWANNFLIGESGNHLGFENSAKKVKTNLYSYISRLHEPGKDVKVWITGYSRAGAVSDVLATLILDNNSYSISEDKLFTYTFEAPASVANRGNYKSIFNFVNNADLVTYIPPVEYGLSRAGIDISTYDSNVQDIVSVFDAGIVLPEFTASDDFATEQQFINRFITLLLKETDDEGSLATRQEYIDNYQSQDIGGFISFFFGLPESTTAKIMDAINPMNDNAKISVLKLGMVAALGIDGTFGTDNPFPDAIEPILAEDGIAYSHEDIQKWTDMLCRLLHSHTDLLSASLVTTFIKIETKWGWPPISAGLNEANVNNVSRAVTMHYPEITYCLISDKVFENPAA